MPFMDGCSATSHIRSQGCKVPIISVTSATTEAECIRYIQNGMTDILAKPYHLNTLWNVLRK
jgi:osomolarity two-component system response regulator SKN7